MQRRDVLRVLCQGGSGAAVLGAANTADAAGQNRPIADDHDAVAMLYDATVCTGCKACVAACTEANELAPDTALSNGLWQMPEDLNAQTKNIIKLARGDEDDATSYVKRQCMHCLEPACVSGCPFGALMKRGSDGVVTWDASRCIGCRYCEIACPFDVPKFEWSKFNPKIVKCEFCAHRLEKGEEPACTEVCPTRAVIFGHRADLLAEAHRRIDERPGAYYEDRVYGEHDGGGMQVLYLSALPFGALGLPALSRESVAHYGSKVHAILYKWLALPLAIYVVLAAIIKRRWIITKPSSARCPKKPGSRVRYERDTSERPNATTLAARRARVQRADVQSAVHDLLYDRPRRYRAVVVRAFGGLGFTGMSDAYAWGIWKTFNVMTLTALGSGGFAIGIAAWVFNWHRLHIVMRTALLTSFVFYFAGLVALTVDVGRPWNLWHVLFPTHWNTESALLEVAVCMSLYAVFFLAFENLPPVFERVYVHASDPVRKHMKRIFPMLKAVYPFVVAGAYVLPMMHQSSLGALLLLAGQKLHPLWQTQMLPLLYVIQAGVAGVACVIITLLVGCLVWRRRIDTKTVGELADLMSRIAIAFVVIRYADVLYRGQIPSAMKFDFFSVLFHIENLALLIPVVVLWSRSARETPRTVFLSAISMAFGAMLYRFVPTTISFVPGELKVYFPTAIEILMAAGYLSLTIVLYSLAVKVFAIVPASVTEWHAAVAWAREHFRTIRVDPHGKASSN